MMKFITLHQVVRDHNIVPSMARALETSPKDSIVTLDNGIKLYDAHNKEVRNTIDELKLYSTQLNLLTTYFWLEHKMDISGAVFTKELIDNCESIIVKNAQYILIDKLEPEIETLMLDELRDSCQVFDAYKEARALGIPVSAIPNHFKNVLYDHKANPRMCWHRIEEA